MSVWCMCCGCVNGKDEEDDVDEDDMRCGVMNDVMMMWCWVI